MRKHKKTSKPAVNPMDADEQRKESIEQETLKLCWKRANKFKALLVFLCIVATLAPIISIHSQNQMTSIGYELGKQLKYIKEDKPGKPVALQAVNTWLNGNDTPFRNGYSNLWWDDAKHVATKEANEDSGQAQIDYWSHTMSFTDKTDGTTRTVTQLIAVQDDVSTAVGTPTIMPKTVTGAASENSYTPQGYTQLDQPETLNNVVKAWAEAYVGKDMNALTVLVADPNTTHVYQPAAVGTLQSATINWLFESTKHGEPVLKEQSSKSPKYAIASLNIGFVPYKGANDDKNVSVSASTMTICVLIENPTQGSARIVDWGANGSVTTLSPYANALNKDSIMSGSNNDEDSDSADSSEDSSDADSTDSKQDSNANNTDSTQNNNTSTEQQEQQ